MSKHNQPSLPPVLSGPMSPGVLLRPSAPPDGVTVAHFTAGELDTLKRVCRDSENENAARFLAAALARADR
jgi:hypothetical protein